MVKGASKAALEKAIKENYLTLDPQFGQAKTATRLISAYPSVRSSAIANAVSARMDAGGRASDIRVICATCTAADRFPRLLDRQSTDVTGSDSTPVEVTTTRELALQVLATPSAQKTIGRTFSQGPRLLSSFEVDFIMEDLKTSGVRPSRLRELMKFLYRGFTELADEGEGWLITVEEQDTVAALQAELGYLQGLIEPELSNLATKALRADPALRATFARRFQFVNDYQNLSRASQLLCNLLSIESIVIAADPDCALEVLDSYPYLAGIEEFVHVNPVATTRLLDQPVQSVSRTTVAWDTPDDEIAGIADLVARQVAEGVAPARIAIACFHPYWYSNLAAALAKRSIPVSGLFAPLVLKGDIREMRAALPLRMVSALRLLADAGDSMSWRCWIGYGDYLGCSSAFVPTREQVLEANPQAHFSTHANSFAAASKLAELLESCNDKTGSALLEHLARQLSADGTADIPKLLRPLLELGDDATPQEMLDKLERQQFLPAFPPASGVAIGSLESIAALTFDTVYIAGFVNGLFPVHKYFDLSKITINQQTSMEAVDKQRIGALARSAERQVIASHFDRAEQWFADRCELRQKRIFIEENGTRYSRVSLSVRARDIELPTN